MNKHLKCLRVFLMICGGVLALGATGISIGLGMLYVFGDAGLPVAIGVLLLSLIGFLTYTVCGDS